MRKNEREIIPLFQLTSFGCIQNQATAGKSYSSSAPTKLSLHDPDHKDFIQERSPPSLTVRQSESTLSMSEMERFLTDETILRVEILSHRGQQDSSFSLPVSLLVQRELDMRKAAASFGIGRDRWSDSLLYREWRYQSDDDASSRPTANLQARQSGGEKTLRLDPEHDCAASNHSQSLIWNPWLTTCIRAYYNTETIRIPDDCNGSDILLALEYFGIVYTPEQLSFDSFGAYLRVKLWSDYFTHRSKIADWVVQKLLKSHSRHSHSFATSPDSTEGAMMIGSKQIDILDGGLILDTSKYEEHMPSCRVVYDFFNDDEHPEGGPEKLDALMRGDFRAYVQHSLPGTDIIFTLRNVSLQRSGLDVISPRAVLHIEFVSKSSMPVVDSMRTDIPSVDTPRRTMLSRAISRKAKTVAVPNEFDRRFRDDVDVKKSTSVDHIFDDLAQLEVKNSPSSTDAIRLIGNQLNTRRPLSNTPSDEHCYNTSKNVRYDMGAAQQSRPSQLYTSRQTPNSESEHNPLAPVQQIDMYDDYRTVASGLTGPWAEDEHQHHVCLMPNMSGTPNISGLKCQPNNSRLGTLDIPPKIRSASQQCHDRGVPDRNVALLDTNSVHAEFMTPVVAFPNTFPQPTMQPPNHERSAELSVDSKTQQTTNSAEIFTELKYVHEFFVSMCSFFDCNDKIVEKASEDDSQNISRTANEVQGTTIPAQSKPKSAMSHVEAFLPEYNIHKGNDEKPSDEEMVETLEDMTAAWLRNAFCINQYSMPNTALTPSEYNERAASPQNSPAQLSQRSLTDQSKEGLHGPSSPVRVMDISLEVRETEKDTTSSSSTNDVPLRLVMELSVPESSPKEYNADETLFHLQESHDKHRPPRPLTCRPVVTDDTLPKATIFSLQGGDLSNSHGTGSIIDGQRSDHSESTAQMMNLKALSTVGSFNTDTGGTFNIDDVDKLTKDHLESKKGLKGFFRRNKKCTTVN